MPLVLIHTGIVKYLWQILILYSIQFAYPTYSGSPFSEEIAIMIRHYVIHPYLKIRHYVIHPTNWCSCFMMGIIQLVLADWPVPIITMKLWHWKSHWKFLWHWKDTETTLKNIYKGNHSDNPGLSHRNIFLCCSRTLKSHRKFLNHTEKFSALLISFVPRFFSVTLDFQCDFQCHNFIVYRDS